MSKAPVNVHDQYHAHVYYDETTGEFAKSPCTDIGKRFGLEIGRFHDKPIGPHPCWSCQIKFSAEDFDILIPWLDENRNGLTILVHGLSDDDLADHTDHAYWLGKAETLNLEMAKKS